MKTLISILVFSIFAVGIECSFNRLKLFTGHQECLQNAFASNTLNYRPTIECIFINKLFHQQQIHQQQFHRITYQRITVISITSTSIPWTSFTFTSLYFYSITSVSNTVASKVKSQISHCQKTKSSTTKCTKSVANFYFIMEAFFFKLSTNQWHFLE